MKKVISLVLAVVLAFGMATAGFAAAPKITGVASDFGYYYGSVGASGNFRTGSIYLDGETRPDATVKLYMTAAQFEWEPTDYPETKDAKLTSSNLSTYKITVKKKTTKGSNVLDEITLEKDKNNMYIEIDFVEEWVSTSEQDFDFTVYLARSSSKIEATVMQISGTMSNEEILLDEDEEEVDLSDGQYAKAEDYIKAIKVDTGNGLFINTKMFDGKKYYAKSNQKVSAADNEILSQYPEIDTIYTLNTINMSSAGNTVEFDIDDKYYVYNADGKYVGTTTEKLPFSSKYYMSTARIDMGSGSNTDDVAEPAPSDEPVDNSTGNPVNGGDDLPANSGDNPGTGSNSFVNLAVVAGLIALAAAGIASKKR